MEIFVFYKNSYFTKHQKFVDGKQNNFTVGTQSLLDIREHGWVRNLNVKQAQK